MLEKAPGAGADAVFLDLEDAVAPDEKEAARENVIEALLEADWSACTVSVRINALDTHWCYRDVVEVVERAGHRVDALLVPKVNRASDLQFVATLLGQIEAARGLRSIALHGLIETALGLVNVDEIARAVPERLEALVFGVADYAASTAARTTSIGGSSPDYAVLTDAIRGSVRERHWADQWHYPLSRLVVACRAYGLRPIDGPFGDIGDSEGYLACARRAAVLGCEGKWAIHPSQVPLANDVFSPTPAELEHARRILDALADAAARGLGAVTLDGRLIDAASIRMAEGVVARAARIEAPAGA